MKAGRRTVRLQDLLGSRVRTRDGRVVGRIEEVCAERRDDVHEVTEYHIGAGALLERWGMVRRLLGKRPGLLVARWDQIDITAPESPVLTCSPAELRRRR